MSFTVLHPSSPKASSALFTNARMYTQPQLLNSHDNAYTIQQTVARKIMLIYVAMRLSGDAKVFIRYAIEVLTN